jgi:hypothetical protein
MSIILRAKEKRNIKGRTNPTAVAEKKSTTVAAEICASTRGGKFISYPHVPYMPFVDGLLIFFHRE